MKILVGIVAVIACFYLVEALDCNKCTFSVFGFCLSSSTPTCSTNTSVCYSSKFTFTDVTSFTGVSKQGCTESTNCAISANSNTTTTTTTNTIGPTFFNISYTITNQCCNTDKCNTVNLSGGASATSMSLSVVLSAAALAVVGWSHL